VPSISGDEALKMETVHSTKLWYLLIRPHSVITQGINVDVSTSEKLSFNVGSFVIVYQGKSDREGNCSVYFTYCAINFVVNIIFCVHVVYMCVVV
jgi:hypothetical protein